MSSARATTPESFSPSVPAARIDADVSRVFAGKGLGPSAVLFMIGGDGSVREENIVGKVGDPNSQSEVDHLCHH